LLHLTHNSVIKIEWGPRSRRQRLKKAKYVGALAATALVLSGCAGGSGETAASSDLRFVNVVKLIGVGWFDRMDEGIVAFASETGIDATQTGADDASPEKQVRLVEDLIAQGVNAITVVPNSPESLEGVFQKARDAGIIVVTHEAASQKNTDADIEAFDNTAYGETIMDNLAECMGNEGQYAAFVGQVTAESHMQWVAGALAKAAADYPGIERVEDPLESKENADTAYEQTKELMKKYPKLKGIQGSSAVDVVGIGRAVEELGLNDSVCVMGTSIPSLAGKFLDTGAIDKIFFWDPALAGHAMMKIAEMLVNGEELSSGMDLGLDGYDNVQQSPDVATTWYGSAWVIVDKDNAADYPF
jgi:simple sugar transport system substrate-binding protein